MATHRLDPAPDTTADVFSPGHRPVLTVDPGDTIVVSSLDAAGSLERQSFPGDRPPRMFREGRGHCLTGPIAVRGARPGDVLAVTFDDLRPGDWGWTTAGGRDTPVTRRLGLENEPPARCSGNWTPPPGRPPATSA